jgi:hypothetical protein
MSSLTPTYSASVSTDVLKYLIAYATGNDSCIESMTASFQPSGQSTTGYNITSPSTTNSGFFLQQVNVPQGVGVQIVFFSLTIPQGTFSIDLTFTTTQGKTYQLAQVNTLPPNTNYALVIIVSLIITAQPVSGVSISSLLEIFASFASNQCSTQQPPSLSYQGSGFAVIYQYTYTSESTFNALLIAQNINALPSVIQVTVAMGGNTVATATISTPPLEYAYFLFTLALEFVGE